MSSRARLLRFLEEHRGAVSREWLRQIAQRAGMSERWPNPWSVATALGLTVREGELAGIRFARVGEIVVLSQHDDRRVMGHRLATAIAQYLLGLSNARWTQEDSYVLAFELLMPVESVRQTPTDQLARCQPYAHPNLLAGWAEHVSKSA